MDRRLTGSDDRDRNDVCVSILSSGRHPDVSNTPSSRSLTLPSCPLLVQFTGPQRPSEHDGERQSAPWTNVETEICVIARLVDAIYQRWTLRRSSSSGTMDTPTSWR